MTKRGSTRRNESMTTTQSPPDNAGVRFPPPFIYVAVFLVALLVQRLYPVTLLPQGIRRVVALFCLAAWLVISGSSIALFRRARTSVMPVKPTTAIVTSGPYGWTRNPLYLALLFLYVGIALWFGLFWVVVSAPLAMILVHLYVIPREERYLEHKFGEEYLRYKARVRRWL